MFGQHVFRRITSKYRSDRYYTALESRHTGCMFVNLFILSKISNFQVVVFKKNAYLITIFFYE